MVAPGCRPQNTVALPMRPTSRPMMVRASGLAVDVMTSEPSDLNVASEELPPEPLAETNGQKPALAAAFTASFSVSLKSALMVMVTVAPLATYRLKTDLCSWPVLPKNSSQDLPAVHAAHVRKGGMQHGGKRLQTVCVLGFQPLKGFPTESAERESDQTACCSMMLHHVMLCIRYAIYVACLWQVIGADECCISGDPCSASWAPQCGLWRYDGSYMSRPTATAMQGMPGQVANNCQCSLYMTTLSTLLFVRLAHLDFSHASVSLW